MILDKQLYRNYNELYELLLCCYKDVSILKAYEKLQTEKSDLYNKALHISNYFVVLAQKDLALTLWKIYCDSDSNANTVPRFRNTINQLLRNSGYEYKQVNKGKTNKSIENKLKVLRKKFLAHTDMKRNDSKIKICELKELLDAICKEFNNACNAIDDDKVVNISEIDIEIQGTNCYMELLSLYI